MHVDKQWRFVPPTPGAEDLASRLGLTRIAAQMILNRGLSDPEEIRAFLHPDLNHLRDPSALPDMDRAAARIREAVERREPIVIYGDYDVDGATATAILLRCLALVKAEARFYVPDRLEEGYGLNADAVKKLAAEGARLLITVDCGITAVEEIAVARSRGMDVIVTDHHEPAEQIPADAILIDPKLPGSTYPFRGLSGAGLAFKLAWAIGKTFSAGAKVSPEFREFLLDAISLAALGTVADVVPLRDENRTIAHFGLGGLGESTAPGIMALREVAGIKTPPISAFDVAFKIAPRLNAVGRIGRVLNDGDRIGSAPNPAGQVGSALNAAGRIGPAALAVELLTTDSHERAQEIAQDLNRENSRRQRIQAAALTQAREMLEAAGGVDERFSIVLAGEDWRPGVIGIVAARLAGEFCRPTVLLTHAKEPAHGSARSIPGFHLFETLQQCSDRLIAFGGHAQAAGLRIERKEVEAFTQAFEQAAAGRLKPEDLVSVIHIESQLSLTDITRPLMDEINALAPFGEGNVEPLFSATGVTAPSGIRRMGAGGRHLSFWTSQNGTGLRAVGFGMGPLAEELTRRTSFDVAFVPRINRWRGSENIELEVKDIRFDTAG